MGPLFGMIYLAALLIRPQELFIGLASYNVMDILAGFAAAGLLLDVLIAGTRPGLGEPQVLLLTAFVGWAATSVVLAFRWLGGAWLAFEVLGVAIFVFYVIVMSGTSLNRLTWLRRTMIASMLGVLLLATGAYFFGGRWEQQFVLADTRLARQEPSAAEFGEPAAEETRRVPEEPESLTAWVRGEGRPKRLRGLGFLNDPNDLAQMLIALLPLAFLGWERRSPFRNLLLVWIPSGFILLGVLLTRSRGGLVALAALAGFAVAQWREGRLSRALEATLWAVLLLAPVVLFRAGLADGSALGRREAWSEGISMIRSSPVWGAGFGAFGDASRVAHNSFVHCFGELGYVGYWLWLGAILVSLWQLRSLTNLSRESETEKSIARWAIALRLSLLSFLVSSLFLSRTYSPTLFILMGFPAALASVAHRTGIATGPHPMRFAVRTSALAAGTILLSYILVRLSW